MSQPETQGQEPVSAQQPAADAGANEVRTPAPRINEAKLESAHAELPPLSVIGATAEPAAKPGTIVAPKQFGRRGVPRGAAPTANGPAARPVMGVVENPADLTETISGALAQQPAQPREPREQREPREPRQPQDGTPTGDRPQFEERPRREPRQEGIPQGDRPRYEDRPRREPRQEGAAQGDRPRFEDRPRREPRQEGIPQGDRPRYEDRPRREPRQEGAPQGDRPRREERPRIQIEPVVIPVQAPIGFWATLKRKLASLFGIPNKAVFVPSERPEQARGDFRGERNDRGPRGHSRGGPRGDSRGGSRGGPRGGRGDFRGERGPRNGPREG
jgi:hypothetical protein